MITKVENGETNVTPLRTDAVIAAEIRGQISPLLDQICAIMSKARADGYEVYPMHVDEQVYKQLLYIDQCRLADEECRQYKGDPLPHPETVRRVRLADVIADGFTEEELPF